MKELKQDFCVLYDVTTGYTFIEETDSCLANHADYIIISESIPVTITTFPEEEIAKLALVKLKQKEEMVNAAAQAELNNISKQKDKFLSLTHNAEQ